MEPVAKEANRKKPGKAARARWRAPGALVEFMWTAAAITSSVALAAAAAWPIYETSRVALVAAGGLVIGAGAVLGAKALGWRWWSAVGLAFATYVVAVVPLAIPSAMTDPGRTARGVIEGVAEIATGWKLLLTVSIPAGTYQGVLVPFLVVVVTGSFTATGLVMSSKRAAPWAVVPMLAMVIFGAAFGSDAAGEDVRLGPATIPAPLHVLVTGIAVLVAATWLIGRARIQRAIALRVARSRTSTVRQSGESRALVVRRQLLAGALVLLAISAGVAAAPIATALGPRDALREGIDPVLVLDRQPSPLASYRNNFNAAGYSAELFTVSGGEGVDRIRIATLDTYDGETFHVGDAQGSALFSREPRSQSARIRITIGAGYSGIWVPVVEANGGAPRFRGDRAEELADAYYASHALDAAVVVTADADAGAGLGEGDSYLLDADAPTANAGAFASATGGDPLISAEDYPALADWVEAQKVSRTGSDLTELVSRMRARGYLSHSTSNGAESADWVGSLKTESGYVFSPSRSGHSAARVDELFAAMLDQERRAGPAASADVLVAAVGDDEQFATGAALLARYLGFDSRVVIGVRMGGAETVAGVPACQSVCTGANVTAWTEVRSSGDEWVVLDTTPQFEVTPTRIREGEHPPENATEVTQLGSNVLEPPAAQADATDTPGSEAITEPEHANPAVATLVFVLTTALAAALVGLPFAVFPVVKVLRRRWRRHAAVAEVAMVGAWDELLDTYIDLGIEIPRGLTRAELADVLDRPAAATLAAIVDRAVFAEHPPLPEAARATWDILTAERRLVAHESPLRRRVLAVFNSTSLVRTLRAQRQVQYSTRLAGRIHHEL